MMRTDVLARCQVLDQLLIQLSAVRIIDVGDTSTGLVELGVFDQTLDCIRLAAVILAVYNLNLLNFYTLGMFLALPGRPDIA